MNPLEILQLKTRITETTQRLRQDREGSGENIEGYLRTLNGDLDLAKEKFSSQLEEFKDQFEGAAKVLEEIATDAQEESEVEQKVIRGTNARLDALKASIAVASGGATAAAVAKESRWPFLQRFRYMLEKFQTDMAFNGIAGLVDQAGVVKEKKKGWLGWALGFIFRDSPERELLAQALDAKGFSGIEVKDGGNFKSLGNLYKAEYSSMAWQTYCNKIAVLVKQRYPGATTTTYQALLAAANDIPKPAATSPETVPTQKEVAATNLLNQSAVVRIEGYALSAMREPPQFVSKGGNAMTKFQLSGLEDLQITTAKLDSGKMKLAVSSKEGQLEGELSETVVKHLATNTLSEAEKKIRLFKGGVAYELQLDTTAA